MPKYQVALDDGRKFVVEADAPPSADDVYAALGHGGSGGAPPGPDPSLTDPARKPASAEDFLPERPGVASLTGSALKGAWDTLNPIAAAGALAHTVRHPIDTATQLLMSQLDQFKKATDDYHAGHYSEMLGHGAAGALPVLGPAAAHAGEQIGTGDPSKIAQGLGETAGLVLGVTGVPKMKATLPEAAAAVTTGGQGKMSAAAERIIASNMKVPATLKAKNPTVNFSREVLNAGYAPGEKGALQAEAAIEDLGNQVTAKVQGTKGTFSLQPVLDQLDRLEADYLHAPNGAGDLAAVRQARAQLMQHPLYSDAIMSPQTTMVPTGVLGANGQMGMRAQTTMVATGRKLVDQTAPEIDTMKKNVYGGLKGKYGTEKGAVIEADKAEGRGLKRILDDNVPGVKPLNAVQGKQIAVRNALSAMGGRETNKLPIGLMDVGALGSAATSIAMGHPALALPLGAALMLKHPLTAFPIARGLDRIGQSASAARTIATGVQSGQVGNRISNSLQAERETRPDSQARPDLTALLAALRGQ